jgi:AhpD family alkylhydroperoxidase
VSRINFGEHVPEVYKALRQAEESLAKGPLDGAVRGLVKIRASQLNGCLYCIDMHIHEALAVGESNDRIYQVSAWRDSELFTPAERAALAYAEAATEQPSGVSDELWDEVTAEFKTDEAANLVAQVAMINAWNRIAAPTRSLPPKRS